MRTFILSTMPLFLNFTPGYTATFTFTTMNGYTKAWLTARRQPFTRRLAAKVPWGVENGDNCQQPQLPPFSTPPTAGPRTPLLGIAHLGTLGTLGSYFC